MSKKIKPIAIYLPQFHPIPENNEWWGNGFTEWTNVTKAKPLFKDHYQPHLPADLGFYDLRLEEARLAQEGLAKANGIYGFCYYHYWFNSKRILEEPLNKKLKNSKEDLPFMLCWANENWTRIWNGGDTDVLLKQEYSDEDDFNHIQVLISYFKDERYIKVIGKPMFVIYRPKLFPDIKKTIAFWRSEVKKAGFPDLYIGFAKTFEYKDAVDKNGFDFAFEFQPNFELRPPTFKDTILKRYFFELFRKLNISIKNKYHLVYDYEVYANLQINNGFYPNTYPTVTPGWDNSARRKINYFILHNSSPEKYKNWLKYVVKNYPWQKMPDSFLFINAWNEWAEGNHLEPCQKWGKAYLEATKEIIEKINFG
jgi:lipopolysaccharide biosynthesis protein